MSGQINHTRTLFDRYTISETIRERLLAATVSVAGCRVNDRAAFAGQPNVVHVDGFVGTKSMVTHAHMAEATLFIRVACVARFKCILRAILVKCCDVIAGWLT